MTPRESIELRTRLITNTDAEIAAILNAALVRIKTLLIDQPSDAQRWQLAALESEIRRVLQASSQEAGVVAGQQHSAAAAAGLAGVDGAIAAAGIRIVLPRISSLQLDAMRAFTTTKIAGITLEAANRVNTQLGLAMIGAQTPYEAVEAVTAILGEDTMVRARAIVHSELARAHSTAAFERLRQAAADVPGLKKRWIKSGKLHPREAHVAAHGQLQDWDKPFVLKGGAVKLMYPHDPSAPIGETINCGCTMVAVVPD